MLLRGRSLPEAAKRPHKWGLLRQGKTAKRPRNDIINTLSPSAETS